MARNALARLGDLGQSVWCDEISRKLLLTGGLESLITDDGVTGVTSNPTIFHKAIANGAEYDERIRESFSGGMGAEEIAESLVVEDIRLAADTLESVHSETGGRDGWVSIEVAPKWARDFERSVSEVMRIRKLVDRPNVMVKVPATDEGVAAFRELTGRGYCVNVTLIFSLERYRQVVEAYLTGLEALVARRSKGNDVAGLGDVHSVASFFVSRVDTAVDERLDALAAQRGAGGESSSKDADRLRSLKGKAAVANAKQAYRLFREAFGDPRWEALRSAGANLQRPLWASTSTKNPAYSDIMYVQELIGSDTVNTIPLETLALFRDHGRAEEETITTDAEEAGAHLGLLADTGLDLEAVAQMLEKDGVNAFASSYEALIAAVEEKSVS